jgi:uncharacterized membrane protein YuzA (DUF378 family)
MLELILYIILGGLIFSVLIFALIGVAVVYEFYKNENKTKNKTKRKSSICHGAR